MHRPVIAMVVLASAVMSSAQEANSPEIQVSGEATVNVEPDQAELDIGVVTQAATAQAAAEANATKLDAVIAAVRSAAGPGAKIETVNYSIHPNYHRPRGTEEATIASYTAMNTVRATQVPLDDTGKVIDAATAAGANNVERLQFTVADSESPKLQALGDAAKRARAKADALAEALGLQIVRVISVVEGSPAIVRPYAARTTMMQAEAAAPPTPVEPGAVEIHASVTLRVLVTPR